MDQAELEWKKLGPEYDMLLAWEKIRKIGENFFFTDDVCWHSTVLVIVFYG